MNKASILPARCAPLLTGVTWLLMAGVARSADATAVFNEVMYHPVPAASPEWVEFRNVLSVNLDLSGWSITGGVNFVFPAGTVLTAGGLLVVSNTAGNPPAALGPWTGSLANEGETIRLRNRNGGIVDELAYNDAGGWPIGADGSGSTLAKVRADTASADPASWRVSAQTGGTPGAENFPVPPSAPGIVLNELAPAGPGFFVELRNAGPAAIELDGMILSASDGGGSYVLPPGLLAPGALQSFDAAALGFSPPASAKLFLLAPGQAAEGWRQTYFNAAQLANPLISGPSASVAGVSNELRYALGLTPFETTSTLLVGSLSEDFLSVEYRRRKNLLDVQFTLETTGNFDTWTPLTAPAPVISDNGDGTETVTVSGPASFSPGTRRFLQLRVGIHPAP